MLPLHGYLFSSLSLGIFSYNFFKCILDPFFPFFSFWDPYYGKIGMNNIIPQVSYTAFTYCFHFFCLSDCFSDGVIFSILSSSLLFIAFSSDFVWVNESSNFTWFLFIISSSFL